MKAIQSSISCPEHGTSVSVDNEDAKETEIKCCDKAKIARSDMIDVPKNLEKHLKD